VNAGIIQDIVFNLESVTTNISTNLGNMNKTTLHPIAGQATNILKIYLLCSITMLFV